MTSNPLPITPIRSRHLRLSLLRLLHAVIPAVQPLPAGLPRVVALCSSLAKLNCGHTSLPSVCRVLHSKTCLQMSYPFSAYSHDKSDWALPSSALVSFEEWRWELKEAEAQGRL